MKRIIFGLLITLIGLSVFAAPEMRPASPDIPSEVQSDNNDYMPNGYKTNLPPQTKETSPAQEITQPEEEEEEEVEEYKAPGVNDGVGVNEEVNEETNTPPETLDNTNTEPQNKVKEEVPQNSEVKDNPAKTDNVEKKQPKKEKVKKEKKILTPESIEEATPLGGLIGDEENPNIKQMKKEQKKLIKQKKKEAKQKYKDAKPKDGKPDVRKYKDADKDPYIQSIYNEKTEEEKLLDEQNAVPKTYSQDDYEQMYRDTPVPEFSFIHGVDPEQYYDMKSTTWSPYPLLRLNSPIYFKNVKIDRGYYLLTPRQYKDNWYILFKEAGVVKHIIPVIAKDFTPANYYRDNIPEVDMKKTTRWQVKFLHSWGKYIRSSKRRPAVQTNLELTDLDNSFILMDIYYGHYKYSCLFRVEQY